jgi:hypothetical protein
MLSLFSAPPPTPYLAATAQLFLQIEVAVPKELVHGEWSGPLGF